MASGIVAVSAPDRAVEPRDLLKAVDDAEQELRPQPEGQRPQDAAAIELRHADRLSLGGRPPPHIVQYG